MIDDLMSYIPRCETNSCEKIFSRQDTDDLNSDLNSGQELSLAMAYIPDQKWRKLYSGEVALKRGTLFSELDKPFIGEEAVCSGE